MSHQNHAPLRQLSANRAVSKLSSRRRRHKMREREMRKQFNNTVCNDKEVEVIKYFQSSSPTDSLPKFTQTMEPHPNEEDKENTPLQHVLSLATDRDADANQSAGESDRNILRMMPPPNNHNALQNQLRKNANRLKLKSRKRRQKEQERERKKKQGQSNDATACSICSVTVKVKCASPLISVKDTSHSNDMDMQQTATDESQLELRREGFDIEHVNNLSQQMQSVCITNSPIIDSCSDESIRCSRKQFNNTVCAIIYTEHPQATPPKPKRNRGTMMSDSDSSDEDVPLSVLASRKRERENDLRIVVRTIKPLKKGQPNEYSVTLSTMEDTKRGTTRRVEFKFSSGDTFQCIHPNYEGFAFTLDKPDGKFAVCQNVWMKTKKTYLGSMLSDQGHEWVLVKKHPKIPSNGKIHFKYLWNGTKLPGMNLSIDNALCYEEENASSFAYYRQLGERVQMKTKTSKKAPIVLDLCAGGGGMSCGLRDAGFNVKYKVDSNETACDTLRRNFPNSEVHTLTLLEFLKRVKRRIIDIDLSRVILLHVSPPCQAFSRINTSGGVDDETNAQCTLDFLEVAKYVQPPFITMENVEGILDEREVHGTTNTKNWYIKRVMSELISMDYNVRICKLRASDFGDPTKRDRVVLFASKRGWKLAACPAPNHGNGKGLAPVTTCRDALKELEEIDPAADDRVVTLDDGRQVWGHFEERTVLTEKHETYESLKADKPAITIRKTNPVKHYNGKRFITIHERSRLMSFPSDYVFEGDHQDCCNQIGNAVPVKLAGAIGRAVMESYRLGMHH